VGGKQRDYHADTGVQCIEASDERSILFFANSVAHADEMTARLNLTGITASCRIVTVMDNLGRFQDRHPYHYCQAHFKAIRSGSD
jgi:hypothetical protein